MKRRFRAFKPVKSRRRKGPLPFRYVFLISFLIFSLMTAQGLVIVEKGIRPTLISIAKTETQRIGTLAINDAISKQILENTNLEEVIETEMGPDGSITYMNFNPVIFNKVLQQTTQRVQSYLNDIEHGRVRDVGLPTDVNVEREGATFSEDGIIHMIPLGQATNNALLAHLGPRVPVRLSAIGDVKSQLRWEAVPLGINNTWISISVEIEADVKIVIPFATDTAAVTTSIAVANVYIPGEVPEFYGTGVTPVLSRDLETGEVNVSETETISTQENLPGD
ncbi:MULTISPECIES: sporulation protein YunB [Alteribacter]|uniref:Sporulation protein YunB n=1 Tax=Alteribacter keqinensis TaxID=2483800 RepID=A0A3M7TQW6_9BACI|nr:MULTISPECIES: sporulation protein YunB [Alteribacter]MBM7097002.1 sporulation protein YunB [Alteribacter salitolerans]RNA67420.1 sporulation protein YunB [Alteribacter keqinensis]